MTEEKRVREVWFNTGPLERLLIVPGHEDRSVHVYRQYQLSEPDDDWFTDPDAGIIIESGLLPPFIDALTAILGGLNARPMPTEEKP